MSIIQGIDLLYGIIFVFLLGRTRELNYIDVVSDVPVVGWVSSMSIDGILCYSTVLLVVTIHSVH